MLSILIFFSISFITVLFQIGPFHRYGLQETYQLNIGFPFTYYEQFWVNKSYSPNSGWHLDKLFIDCLITWISVVGLYLVYKKKE
jgi:hypothetical protein